MKIRDILNAIKNPHENSNLLFTNMAKLRKRTERGQKTKSKEVAALRKAFMLNKGIELRDIIKHSKYEEEFGVNEWDWIIRWYENGARDDAIYADPAMTDVFINFGRYRNEQHGDNEIWQNEDLVYQAGGAIEEMIDHAIFNVFSDIITGKIK